MGADVKKVQNGTNIKLFGKNSVLTQTNYEVCLDTIQCILCLSPQNVDDIQLHEVLWVVHV